MQTTPHRRHRVVILGAGYAGLGVAGRLARQVDHDAVSITLISHNIAFVERPRLHQAVTGQRIRQVPIALLLKGTHVKHRVANIEFIDLDHRSVAIDADGAREFVPYDTLVYALGSRIDTTSIPGITRHAVTLEPSMVSEVKRRLHEVRDVAVCGGGLTAIEAATEIAESNPGLRVTIYSDKPPGAWLSPRARRHVERAFRRMGIHVRDGLSIDCIRSGNLYMNDGSSCAFDLCIWAGGFTVPALAADSGLVVDARGRAIVDSQLRAIGHPEVYVIGDAASASGAWGDSIAYGCRTSGFQGPYVADLIRSCLLGGETWPFDFRYLHQCVSLGRRDAVIQFVHPRTEAPCDRILTGWLAVIYKEFVLRSAIWMFRHPGPYFWRQREASTVRNDEQRLASVREGDADDPRSWPPR